VAQIGRGAGCGGGGGEVGGVDKGRTIALHTAGTHTPLPLSLCTM
jgi:hypothetical protein